MREFIKFLEFIAEKGADKGAKVEKLEFYRKLDKHRQHLQLVEDQREGLHVVQDAVMRDDG